MKVKDFIKKFGNDPERIIVLASDAEGNSYSVLGGGYEYTYKDGEIGLEKLTEKDKKAGYSEEDVLEGGKKAIVLFPV